MIYYVLCKFVVNNSWLDNCRRKLKLLPKLVHLDFVGANLFLIVFDRTTSVGRSPLSAESEVMGPILGTGSRLRVLK